MFRTLILYQINKLMHDAHISTERSQMLSLLCGDIFSSLDSIDISLILLYTFAFNDLLPKERKR